jgi:hypothetical protein
VPNVQWTIHYDQAVFSDLSTVESDLSTETLHITPSSSSLSPRNEYLLMVSERATWVLQPMAKGQGVSNLPGERQKQLIVRSIFRPFLNRHFTLVCSTTTTQLLLVLVVLLVLLVLLVLVVLLVLFLVLLSCTRFCHFLELHWC